MKCLLALLCCLFLYPAFAQRTEIQARAGSGLFFFHGKSAVENQNAHMAVGHMAPFTKPYGRKPGASATVEIMLKRVARSKFIFGLGSGYQRLSSGSSVDTLFVVGDFVPSIDTFTVDNGSSTFKGNFINVTPFAGRRFMIGKTALDIRAGMEIGFLLKSREDVELDDIYSSEVKKYPNPRKADVRLHLSADVNIRKLIIFAKYARGITNYYRLYTGGQPEAYSNFIQLGVGYRLK
jgi:hypothetical protein